MAKEDPVDEWMSTETKDGKHVSFGLDRDGRLYINRKLVVTEQKIELDRWVTFAVVLGALGALAQGVVAIATYYK